MSATLQGGRLGNTNTGSYYRLGGTLTANGANRGHPVPAGTLTRVEWTRTDAGSATLEVINNGAPLGAADVTTAVAGRASSGVIAVAVTAGTLSCRNKTGGSQTTNVWYELYFEPT